MSRVELSTLEGRVDVWAEHPPRRRFACPECDRSLGLHDHAEERVWRHLDSCQFLTYLHARPPRVECPEHGVRQVRLPWAEPMSRFTTLFERLAIDVLRECHIQGAARLLRLSWDEAWHLLERAVARGRAAKQATVVAHVGVDETAVRRGHNYLTVVSDLDRQTVEHVAEERRQQSLDSYFERLTPTQRSGIEAVAMDMWEPYLNSARAHLADAEAKIVFDRFHVMRHMGTAVDSVRKREHRLLRAAGDDRLLRSKYLWLYAEERVPERDWERFAGLREADLKTARAWAIKESLRYLWSYVYRGWALRHWRHWYFWATHSRLQPVIAVARMLKRRLQGVLNFYPHRITSAACEGLNAHIQKIKSAARGYRNLEHFKAAIYFHCGGLDLYPRTHSIPG